jgi:hypothetical protein
MVSARRQILPKICGLTADASGFCSSVEGARGVSSGKFYPAMLEIVAFRSHSESGGRSARWETVKKRIGTTQGPKRNSPVSPTFILSRMHNGQVRRTWSSRYVLSDTCGNPCRNPTSSSHILPNVYCIQDWIFCLVVLSGGILLVHNHPVRCSCTTGRVRTASRLNQRNGPGIKGRSMRVALLRHLP